MSNLNTKISVTRRLVAVSVLALGVAASILGCSTTQETRHDDASTRGIQMVSCLEMDAICSTPDSGPEQQPVGAYFIEASDVVTPPQLIQAPTMEFPYGDLEGSRVSITIETDGNVWLSFADSIVGLDPVESEDLTRNLVRKLEAQEGRNLDRVNAGEKYTLDLKWEPSRYGTPALPGEFAPEGYAETPQGGGNNPFSGGTSPSTNPNLGTSQPEKISVSDELNTGSIMPPAKPCDPRSLACTPEGE